MNITKTLQQRRSYYSINKKLPVSEETIIKGVQEITTLVPDAFNMKSARVVLAFHKQHDLLWDSIYDAFNGAVPKEKIESFKAGAGTLLYFYDKDTVEGLQAKFPTYASNFPIWANQANGMLQLSVWCALREWGLGASLQHYNPVIDKTVHALFDVPENYTLVAQMPFGGIESEPEEKQAETLDARVRVFGV